MVTSRDEIEDKIVITNPEAVLFLLGPEGNCIASIGMKGIAIYDVPEVEDE